MNTGITSTDEARAVEWPQFNVMRPHTHIHIRGLSKTFGEKVLFDDLDLDILKGKITCIFGPNGCGKSSLLNMIAGLVPIDRGTVLFDGKTFEQTRTGYVFQNYREALFPWMRTAENIAYPLKIAGYTEADRRARVKELADIFDIGFDLTGYPYELSGGQQQLASVMRALAPHPEVLFLDEPFSALDYEMTLVLRDKLQDIFQATALTMVMVSHDLEEAVYLADEILLLTKPTTQVAETLAFDAPRPRTTETLRTEQFVQTKARSLEIFQREVRR